MLSELCLEVSYLGIDSRHQWQVDNTIASLPIIQNCYDDSRIGTNEKLKLMHALGVTYCLSQMVRLAIGHLY